MKYTVFKTGDLVRRYHVGDYKDMFQPPPALGMVTSVTDAPPEVRVRWLADSSMSCYTSYAASDKLVLVSGTNEKS